MLYKHRHENMLEPWHVNLIRVAEVAKADLPSTKGGLLLTVLRCPSRMHPGL